MTKNGRRERNTGVPARRKRLARASSSGTRQISGHVDAVERDPGRVVVRFAPDLPHDRLEAALAVERGCCPFIGVDYDPAARLLILTVDQAAHDPALDALAHALGRGDRGPAPR